MKFRSTNGGPAVTFREATLQGLAPDGGLYMPVEFPLLNTGIIESLARFTLPEIALHVATPFLAEDLSPEEIRAIVESSCNFDAPVITLSDDIASLELFHGPTLAFKDFGARFMAAAIETFQQRASRNLTVLVATSGDTGGAVGHGFLGRQGIRVVILYPKGMVSPLQEKQLTTLGQNVSAVRIDGTFDDCQSLVKQTFKDQDLVNKISLTSANSINVARLIPQMFYYFYAGGTKGQNRDLIFSVPSGNFGNLTAGLMAKRMGLPATTFIAATNANDIVPHYLQSGEYNPRSSQSTLASAMDVGAPSNFSRIQALYGGSIEVLRKDVAGYAVSDDKILETIAHMNRTFGYVCDPHGATGFLALSQFLNTRSNAHGIFLHTAHPAKFPETVRAIVGDELRTPASLVELMNRDGNATDLPNCLGALREYLRT